MTWSGWLWYGHEAPVTKQGRTMSVLAMKKHVCLDGLTKHVFGIGS